MSGVITVTGAAKSGIVPIPTKFPGEINTLISSYLGGLSASIAGGTAGFENYDVVSGTINQTTVSAAGLEEFTNVASTNGGGSADGHKGKGRRGKANGDDNDGENNGRGSRGQDNGRGSRGQDNGYGNTGQGETKGASASGSYSVNASANTVIVQAPGNTILQGNGVTNAAIFGANSNVTYTDINGGSPGAADSIFAAGGNDSITTYSTTNTGSAYDIFSAGNDTINLKNQGTDTVSATGAANTTVFISQAAATVLASGGSRVSAQFTGGGTLDFINNSTNAATVYAATGFAPGSVTAFGGAGGGYFAGGQAGNNSLTGGTGTVTLIGANTGDVLQANAATGTNLLTAGLGNETLLGGATSGTNTFQVGMGGGVANAVVSTGGSGIQTFLLGSSDSSTLTGSTAAGALNLYDFVRNSITAASGPATYQITDFSANSAIFVTDTIPGGISVTSITTPSIGGAEILLSDNSKIYLTGVSANSLVASTDPNGTIRIT